MNESIVSRFVAKMPHCLPFFPTKISLVLVLPGQYDLFWFCHDQSYHTILYRLFPGLMHLAGALDV